MSETIGRIDTDEIREIIKKVGSISENVQYLSNTNVSSMKGTVKSSLKGEAADTLLTTLDELSGDIGKIARGLNDVNRALTAYIAAIEKADQKISQAISGKA